MLFNFTLEDLIPIFTAGAILIIAIYHSILYFFSKLKLVGRYSLYLWCALLYLILATTTVPTKTFVTPTLPYLISSGTFWISLLLYLNFLLTILNFGKNEGNLLFKIIKKTYLITPIYFLFRFPFFFFPSAYVATIKAGGFVMDAYLFFIFIYMVYLLITNKKRDYNSYIVIGSALLMFFNFFTSISYYTQGYIMGLTHVSFIALGYFCDIIFFSVVVGIQLRETMKDKYFALAEIDKKELALEVEKKKATAILLALEFEAENDRKKAIMDQRTTIARKLHDGLSGNLVALRYLVQDYKNKAVNKLDKDRFENIDAEISSIYTEARNYSHELTITTLTSENVLLHNIPESISKLKDQFSAIGIIAIQSSLQKNELTRLSIKQNNHLYYILKECFANTIKHASAKNIWLSINFTQHECTFQFKDDGVGYPVHVADGIGIGNMKSRARDLGGSLHMNALAGGTHISLTFQIDKPN